MSDLNPKPDTAEGVAVLLAETREHVEQHSKADAGVFELPSGTKVVASFDPRGNVRFFDPSEFDKIEGRPSRREGETTLLTLDSFKAFVNRFGDEDSVVFANNSRSAPSVTAILDYHRADTLPTDDGEGGHGEYRFGNHRAKFAFPLSDQWKAWHAKNGERMDMTEFAAFLEDNVLDVAEIEKVPESAARFVQMGGGEKNIADWAKLTALAKSLKIFESGVVSEAVNLASGEGELTISDEHETEIGGVKALVPTMFFIQIPIFNQGVAYRLPVRLRYRKNGSRIAFWYEIWRSDRAFDDAFTEACEDIGKNTPASILYGVA